MAGDFLDTAAAGGIAALDVFIAGDAPDGTTLLSFDPRTPTDATVVWTAAQPDDTMTVDQAEAMFGDIEWYAAPVEAVPVDVAPAKAAAVTADGDDGDAAVLLDEMETRIGELEGEVASLLIDSVTDDLFAPGDGPVDVMRIASVTEGFGVTLAKLAAATVAPTGDLVERLQTVKARLDKLEETIASLMEADVDEVELPPATTMVADEAARTAAAGRKGKLRKFNPAEFGRAPVDGDNDGLIYDGTVRQRPSLPRIPGRGLRGPRPDSTPKVDATPDPSPGSGKVPAMPSETDVDGFIAAHPQREGENFFDWQGRIVADLSPQLQSDVLFRTRETYPAAPYIAAGMQRWNAEHGLPPVPDDLIDRPADIDEADATARFFETTPDMAADPEVRAAYEDFKAQSQEMWEFLTRPESEGGMGIDVDFTTDVDPYPTALAQAEDLERNHHMTIQSGLGGAHDATMTQEEYDRFRAVHDVFGHAGIGSGFDRHGEYEAWLAHAAMYRGQGRRAMSTEYHGVNSAMWSGAPGSPGTGKSVLLPGEMGEPPWLRAANLRTYTDAYLLQLWYAQDQTPQLRAELMSRGILPRSAAVALLSNPVADEYVAKLGLDETFASRFDLLWFHDA